MAAFDRELVIRQALQDGERLMWSGSPGYGAAVVRAIVPTGLGLLFVAGPGVMLWIVLTDPELGAGRILIVGCVSIMLGMGVALAGAGVAGVLASRRTAYAVTDRRVLMVRELFGRRVKDYGPREIGAVERAERADGTGHVEFRRAMTGMAARRRTGPVGFYGVADVRAAAAAIERLRPARGDR